MRTSSTPRSQWYLRNTAHRPQVLHMLLASSRGNEASVCTHGMPCVLLLRMSMGEQKMLSQALGFSDQVSLPLAAGLPAHCLQLKRDPELQVSWLDQSERLVQAHMP